MSFFANSSLSAIPQVAIVLGIMVLVHEFGHFAAAKLCGVRVDAFAIGFGKRLLGFVHNGTDYRLNLVPLGGYVKMAGEYGLVEEAGERKPGFAAPTADPGEYQNHPRWQRVIIALAGPVANFILAFVLLTGLYMTHNEVPAYFSAPVTADYIVPGSQMARTGIVAGDRIVAFDGQNNPSWIDLSLRAPNVDLNQNAKFSFLHKGKRVDTTLFVESKGAPEDFRFTNLGIIPVEQMGPIQVSSISDPTTPAARAGLQPKDIIRTVDGLQFHSVEALVAYLQVQAGKPAILNVERAGPNNAATDFNLSVTPALMDTAEGKGYRLGFINVASPVTVQALPLDEAVAASAAENLKNSRLILDILHRLFTRQVSVKQLSSPIGIGVEVHEALKINSWTPIIEVMAMISLNLGIFNLLPIPILDGGMILFLAIESAMRRDLNYEVKERVYQVAFVCIVLFAAMVIFNDLTRFVGPHVKL